MSPTSLLRKICVLTILLPLAILSCKAQDSAGMLNLGFEQLNAGGDPTGWMLSWNPGNRNYKAAIDKAVKQDGNASLSIRKKEAGDGFGVASLTIPARYDGDTLRLTGYLKTENVTGGYAGLWLRIDGGSGILEFDNMNSRGVTGTSDWKQYEIKLPYNKIKATNIVLGGLLTGDGGMWIDNLQLFLDGQPIEMAPARPVSKAQVWQDTLAYPKSGIPDIALNDGKTQVLTNLGMLWGFLKYYHPAIAAGNYNWDAELFRVLPAILKATEGKAAYQVMEQWVDGLGTVPPCDSCQQRTSTAGVKLPADYGYLFQPGNLPVSLMQKLAFIRDHHRAPSEHYYIDRVDGVHNPIFTHEVTYSAQPYPDAGLRLLALYRYWSIIQYYYPNRHLIGEDWNAVLGSAIPVFVQAANQAQYTLACLGLITRIHDTHANIWGKSDVLDSLKGNMILPFQAAFIEGKLVVTDYYSDDPAIRQQVKVGDVIDKIDGVAVKDLVKKYLPWTPASNYNAQLYTMCNTGGFLLRGNDSIATLSLNGGKSLKLRRLLLDLNLRQMDRPQYKEGKSHRLLPGNIGYIFPARLQDQSIDTIKQALALTKGIVIDMRCYPTSFMPFSYGAWLKPAGSDFVKFSEVDPLQPGRFIYSKAIENGEENKEAYKGRIVILVNSRTISQSEYTTIALRTAPNVVVMGEPSSGADGNVSGFLLPGGIYTAISGIGVFYPDGAETQRVGVKIDIPVHPTVKGVKAGRDELLERALSYIETGK